MKIRISGNRKVAAIQNDFNKLFPFLNLEFFHLPENQLAGGISAAQSQPQLSVKDIRKKEEDGELVIYRHMTIMQLENMLSDDFGLYAQVYVKSGEKWVRSSFNGYWMLHYKNEEGRRTANQCRKN